MTQRPRVHLWQATRSAAIWFPNPNSVTGATHLFRFLLAAGGPTFHRKLRQMRTHPVGRRLLEERPDLGATLADSAALARMPEGSLGRAYHDFMNRPDVFPGYLLAALAYRDGFFERATEGWDPDAIWMVDRLFNTHDITHALAGYSSNLAAEFLVIFFTSAAVDGGLASDLVSRTTELGLSVIPASVGGARWKAAVREARTRGRSLARSYPFECIAWEDHLERPLDEVRSTIGLPPPGDPGEDHAGWFTGRYFDAFTTGFGTLPRDAPKLASMQTLVEAGLPARWVVAADSSTRETLLRRHAAGDDLEVLGGVLREAQPGRSPGSAYVAAPR